jgi:hypothetical protein
LTSISAWQEVIFPDFTVGLLHGRMTSAEKDAAITAFRDGHTHILVSTTVVEVGVDVPNASVMLIEHAERFGLSQLHQLRGRVGRGADQSFCLLMSATRSDPALQRLRVLEESQDGFFISEMDLRFRGPGRCWHPSVGAAGLCPGQSGGGSGGLIPGAGGGRNPDGGRHHPGTLAPVAERAGVSVSEADGWDDFDLTVETRGWGDAEMGGWRVGTLRFAHHKKTTARNSLVPTLCLGTPVGGSASKQKFANKIPHTVDLPTTFE